MNISPLWCSRHPWRISPKQIRHTRYSTQWQILELYPLSRYPCSVSRTGGRSQESLRTPRRAAVHRQEAQCTLPTPFCSCTRPRSRRQGRAFQAARAAVKSTKILRVFFFVVVTSATGKKKTTKHQRSGAVFVNLLKFIFYRAFDIKKFSSQELWIKK